MKEFSRCLDMGLVEERHQEDSVEDEQETKDRRAIHEDVEFWLPVSVLLQPLQDVGRVPEFSCKTKYD